jgi:hypothetical protein
MARGSGDILRLSEAAQFTHAEVGVFLFPGVGGLSFPSFETVHKESFSGTDVGPLSRQLLTRAEDFFDDLSSLTLVGKLIRGQVPE